MHLKIRSYPTMFLGHIGPAVRISVIRTIKASKYGKAHCERPDCSLPGCKGNCLEMVLDDGQRKEPEDPKDDLSWLPDPQYKITIRHHKTSGMGISMPSVQIQSFKLRRLLYLGETFGRPFVSK